MPPDSLFFFFLLIFFKSSGGWVKIKLQLPHFHVSDTFVVIFRLLLVAVVLQEYGLGTDSRVLCNSYDTTVGGLRRWSAPWLKLAATGTINGKGKVTG